MNYKKAKFERIWVGERVNNVYSATDSLSDDDYIEYKIWENRNSLGMYKKYLPNCTVIRGNNPNIIFHGGCLGCLSQRIHGIDRCKGCLYFRFNTNKPELYIKGEKAATLSGDDFKRLLGGEED